MNNNKKSGQIQEMGVGKRSRNKQNHSSNKGRTKTHIYCII